jgi:hypothetical protein
MEQQQRAGTPSQARGAAKRIPALGGFSTRVRVEAPGSPSRLVEVRDGTVEMMGGNGPVDAVITFADDKSFQELVSGKETPVVLVLQGRLKVEGDLTAASKLLIALHAQGAAGNKAVAS